MAGVGELVASALVKFLIEQLGSRLWSELGLLWNFDNNLEGMKSTLESIEAVLTDAEKRSFKEKSVCAWLKKLKASAYDIEDMFDVDLANNWPLDSSFMAHKLKSMRKRLDKIAQERNIYNLITETTSNYEKEVIEGRETYSTENIGDVLGREEEAEKIINMLLSTTSDTTSVIPIVGLGGLGKTTLANLIFNEDKIKKEFELRIWVYAADFNVGKLAEAILSSSESGDGKLFPTLQSKMCGVKKIINGKLLIVLDDVWNEDGEKWHAFKQILEGGEKEIKIIVTTRSERVSSIMDATKNQHKLKPLSDKDCLKLFEQMAFGSAGEKNSQLASIGMKIVKKCRGVPLAANALGGVLHFKKGEATWQKVDDSNLWELKEEEGSENKIMSSLKLSYQHMPPALKRCFIYCSSYPKAFKLTKDMLIQQWIAQRFIQTENEVEALQIGDDYVKYLLSMSFLEEKKEEEIDSYMKMHDLVYDLARWVAGNEVSVVTLNERECRYASVSNGPSEELKISLARKVRSLHFQNYRNLHKGIFSYTKYLRVLDFRRCSLYELPTSIYELKQLRYLGLPYRLSKVDKQIGKLKTLESLIISHSLYIQTLPTSIDKLRNLIYLEIFYAYELSVIPDSIGDLLKLNNLKLVGCNELRSLPKSLGNLVKLATLTIYQCKALRSLPESLGNLVELATLTIYQCALKSLPESLGKLKKLKTLTVYDCWDIESLPESIGNLVNSEIRIYGCKKLIGMHWKRNR